MNNQDQPATSIAQPTRTVHPWHGIEPRVGPTEFRVYIENVAHDLLKYELDRSSGLLTIDQPFQTSALLPCAYGFVPRTLCGQQVAALSSGAKGDEAPLDIFVLSEFGISIPGLLARVILIGGISTQDRLKADEKLIGVLALDPVFGGITEIDQLPIHHVERITHFLGQNALDSPIEVGDAYGAKRALAVLNAGFADYTSHWQA